MLASLSNLQQIALFLVNDCGADIDHKNRYQETSLHIAKRKNLAKAVIFLQKLGCRMDMENERGVTVNKIIGNEKKANEIRSGVDTIPRGPVPTHQLSQQVTSGHDQNQNKQRYREEFTLNLQSIDPVIGNQNQTDDFGKKQFNQYQTIDSNPSILSPMHLINPEQKRSNAQFTIKKKNSPGLARDFSKQSFDKRV